MTSANKIPENQILLCNSCCQKLLEIQAFQRTCQKTSQTLLKRNLVGANDVIRKRIEQDLQELMKEEKVKIEESTEERIFSDSPVSEQDLKSENDAFDMSVSNDSKSVLTTKKSTSSLTSELVEHCPMCDSSFPTSKTSINDQMTFIDHIDLTHTLKRGSSFHCQHCEAKYIKITNLRRHFRECHMTTNKVRSCKFCPKVFYTKRLFFAHLRKVHSALASRYSCDICKKDFREISYIRRHMLRHIKEIACPNCEVTFNEKSEFRKHKKLCGERYMCHICSIVVFTKTSLEKHIVRMHLPSPPCDICGEEFTRQMDLDHHKKIAHSSKTKVCEQCGKTFFTENGLLSHVKFTHLKLENEYTKKRVWCDICKRFESHTTKNAHELKLKYGKRFKCDFDQCDQAFISRQRLKRHQHSHTKTRPFNCEFCA